MRGSDLETDVSLTFDQAMTGTEITVTVPKQAACTTCHGSGAKPGTAPHTCPRCQGRGVDSESQGIFSISQPCPQCGGRGQVVDDPCPTCQGAGLTMQRKRYRVNVPAGVHDGSRIRVAGKGEDEPRAAASPATSTSGCASPRHRSSAAAPTATSRSACPSRSPRPSTARPSRCRRSTARSGSGSRPGTQHGTIQRLRGEGPPRPGGRGRRDIHYRLEIEVPSRPLTRAGRRAVDDLAKALNGHDPRERILSAAGKKPAQEKPTGAEEKMEAQS